MAVPFALETVEELRNHWLNKWVGSFVVDWEVKCVSAKTVPEPLSFSVPTIACFVCVESKDP